ncbi:hypothetical protein DFP72DRAFT_1213 [Ephemerocybe angulata]|uniref:BZIP domain-containing protein n=1 Tax=Ephemerocybe angulata TaxID=980116 RepID=A0A8H6IJZ1_9AGAR|nr:hypothetical protein DFP72DRAFT_1213 [Tulosesus angulatus]
METYRDPAPLWDFTNAGTGFAQMQDIDFMSLLDKQFHPNPIHTDSGALDTRLPPADSFTGANQNKTASSSRTTPSDDTPSPSSSHDDSNHFDDDGPAPKRKATGDADDGPSSKTMKGSNAASSSSSGRRKSTGNPAKDETRLLKRKEQNRAAQRAFRERKEKHVKDLEDKVAQLEAKNEETTHENENLRDLLTRLQTENVMLKQGQFTFSMPRDTIQPYSADGATFPQDMPSSTRSSFAAPPSIPDKSANPLDWSSLTSFDPSRLNLLDDAPQSQTTATDSAMNLDFGFGPSGLASTAPFTTLASNPMFMSFASTYDNTTPSSTDSPNMPTSNHSNQGFNNFEMNPLTTWSTAQTGHEGSFDDLLQGYLGPSNSMDFSFLTSPISPVTHHISPTAGIGSSRPHSSTSSPSSSSTDPLFTPKDSPPRHDFEGNGDQCPKTKAELVKRIEESGPSPFAPACSPAVRKAIDGTMGSMISCEGATSFPKTQKNENNIEVLSAWRSITSNPKFKDTDISELCAEFTAKARCDGTKVVLEPSSVETIIESLSKKQQSPQTQQ